MHRSKALHFYAVFDRVNLCEVDSCEFSEPLGFFCAIVIRIGGCRIGCSFQKGFSFSNGRGGYNPV